MHISCRPLQRASLLKRGDCGLLSSVSWSLCTSRVTHPRSACIVSLITLSYSNNIYCTGFYLLLPHVLFAVNLYDTGAIGWRIWSSNRRLTSTGVMTGGGRVMVRAVIHNPSHTALDSSSSTCPTLQEGLVILVESAALWR